MSARAADIEPIVDTKRVGTLLQHPIRVRILEHAREPASATEIARTLRMSRQRVNYHVRELAKARLLRRAGQRRKRNLVEQKYVATARSYVIAPQALGPLAAHSRDVPDVLSAGYLMALAAQCQGELSQAMREAQAEDKRISTLSINAELRFTSAKQREEFTVALGDAITEVVANHTAVAEGRPFRLVLGCYPIPPDTE